MRDAMADSPLVVRTERLVIGLPPASMAGRVAEFYRKNAAVFEPWDPPRPADFLTEGFWRTRLTQSRRALVEGREARLFAVERKAPEGPPVSSMSFTGVQRGPLLSCQLGYAQDEGACGRGLMREALAAAIPAVLEELGLHRIEASYVPTNEKSGRVLRALGFVVEGYSRDYLFIGGAWRDHVRCALTNPKPVKVAGA